MEITFVRDGKGRTCRWVALRPPRTRVPGPAMAIGRDLPHDLVTFVVEDALGITDGFWGCVAAGATFRSLDRARTPQGARVIREHADALDDAEQRVNEVYAAWRRGGPSPCTAELDRMLARWRALPADEELVVVWRHPAPNATGKRRRSNARL
jgi:hypothetical protein